MGKNKKKGCKANVFKVAGAKSLKKFKAKAVKLDLKDIKKKILNVDKQFVELKSNNPKLLKPTIVPVLKKTEKKVSKEEVEKTVEKILKMDL